MKFLCGNCKAKYQIADEKVSGRTLRMKCRRCGHDILIDGHSMPASSPPSTPAPVAGSTRRTGTGMSSVSPGVTRGGSTAQPLPARPPAVAGLPRPAAPRSKPPSALGAEFRRHVAAPPEVPQRSAPYDLWHAAIKDVPVGPMTREELARKIEAGAVTAESLCWREGMDDWRPLGELPELSQLLRRNRGEGSWSGRPPPRHRPPPHVPAPQGARASQHPGELEEGEEDFSEPTRIADLQPLPGLPAVGAGAAAHPGGTSPRIHVAQQPAASASLPPPEPVAPARKERGASGLTTGIAVGLLVGILLVGGPILYRNTYGTPAPAPAQQVAMDNTPSKRVEPAERDIQLDLPTEAEEKPTGDTPTKPKGTGGQTGKTKVEPKAETGKKLSDEERRLLERMGVAGGDVNLEDKKPRQTESTGGGPSLTGTQLSKVVQDNKVQLQRCYETALRAAGGKQDGAIKVTVTVVVGMSGTARQVTTQGAGLGNMTECMKQAVKRWRFPASGGESEFAFPLVFQPGA